MPENEDFFISYKNHQVKVSPVINGGNIYFIIHFKTPIAIAERLVNDSWFRFEVDKNETVFAAELGAIIEAMDIV